jgi:predicted ArsR family transcriptional regulator
MQRQSEPTERARDRVLFQLKTKGPLTAAQLARRLKITPMAVRQHLASLEADGLVSFSDRRSGVGRPPRIWELEAGASNRFPDSHADLSVELLSSMREAFGEKGIDRLLAVRAKHQLDSYRERLPDADATLGKRVTALAKIRREEGYMAEVSRRKDGSFLLVENHCPICAAASICQGLCRDELDVFRKTLGDDVTVEREEHALAGARRCAYRITPR